MSYAIFEKLCEINNVTPYQVCKAIGEKTAMTSNWKAGRYTPKADKRRKIAEYFGVSLEFLDAEIEINEEISDEEFFKKVKDYLEIEGFDPEQKIDYVSDDERYVIKFRNALNSMSDEKKQLMKENMDTLYRLLGIDTQNKTNS